MDQGVSFTTCFSSTTLFKVNLVGHTIYEKTNTKNIRDLLWCTLNSNPHYMTTEVYVVGDNISIQWKAMCIWETATKIENLFTQSSKS